MKALLSLLLGVGFSSQVQAYTPAAYFGAYALNENVNALEILKNNYHINHVDVGFLLLQPNKSCSFSNITDGSHTNPILEHVEQYRSFVNGDNGTLGLVFSGAESNNAIDPLNLCSIEELTNLIRDSINASQVPIKRISFDIESHKFQSGQLDNHFYDKLLSVSSNIKSLYNGIDIKVTFPQYSGYWASGYNQPLYNFLSDSNNLIDYVEIMTSANSYQLASWVNSTVSRFPQSLSKAKIAILLTSGNKFSDDFDANSLKEQFSSYAGITTLVTDSEHISHGNSLLFNELNSNGEVIPPTEPTDNLVLSVTNLSATVGINPYFYKNNNEIMNIGYIGPNTTVSYDTNTYVDTDIINGQTDVELKVNYWGDLWVSCPINYDFNSDTVINLLVEPSNNTITCN
ncbi:hypothetical protein KFZ68_11365 [Photobacterium damselae]|uniref:hypothetical protein n=1 Tax=Photobacterium damselae TaxID=38293 RepID=UPI0025429777